MAASGSLNKEWWLGEPNSKRPDYGEFEDRISILPDEIRTHIISFLPMQHSLKTCMLSRSWRRIFSSLPNLLFIESDFPNVENRAQRVARLIDWTLANHDDSNICTFVIKLEFLENSCSLNNAWVVFAVQHNVKNLHLIGIMDESQDLPSCLFTSQSLVILRLAARAQILKLPAAIFLPNLRTLVLATVMFPDDTLTEMLFSGCPLLEVLGLKRCGMFLLTRLTISSPKLRSLYISDCLWIDSCDIYLHTPCMERFCYEGALPRKMEFEKMSSTSCVMLNLERDPFGGRTDGDLAPVALRFLSAMSNARKLSMNLLFNKVLSEVPSEVRQLNHFKNLTQLCLFVRATEEDEEIILTLLGKFIRLQTFQMIIIRSGVHPFVPSLEWHPEKFPLQGILSHLQYLQIDNFGSFPLEIGLLTFFLENAKSLTEVKLRMPGVVTAHEVPPLLSEGLKQAIVNKVAHLSIRFPAVRMTII